MVGPVSSLPINDNSPSDDGFKELFEMMKKISQKQESMDQQIKASIAEHNRGIIKLSNQMSSQKESIEEQNKGMNKLADKMVKIKNNLKTAKAGKSGEDQT